MKTKSGAKWHEKITEYRRLRARVARKKANRAKAHGAHFIKNECHQDGRMGHPQKTGQIKAVKTQRRSSPQFVARVESLRRRKRLREIWQAIREHDRAHAAGTHPVRGIRAAARRAGFES